MPNQFLNYILTRLANSDDQCAIFKVDEIASFSEEAFNTILKNGLLQPTNPATTVECPECEESCTMPVNIINNEHGKKPRIFISCDKRDDIGLVNLEADYLRKWRITDELLAKTLAKLLNLTNQPQKDNKTRCWKLGLLKGTKQNNHLYLNIENGIFLKVAGHTIPVTEVLTLEKGKLTIDKNELLKLVDNQAKSPGDKDYEPSIDKRKARKLKTQERYKAWKKEYEKLKKKHPGKSDVWISLRIEKMEIANGKNSETIRHHMK